MGDDVICFPSKDKPWIKHYSDEEKGMEIPDGTMFDYLYNKNKAYPNDIAIEYYGRTFSYRELFDLIDKCCRNLTELGIKRGDIVTIQAISLPQVIVLLYALTRIGACGNMLYPDAKAKDVVASMEKTDSHLLIVLDILFSEYENDLPDSYEASIILLNVAEYMPLIPRFLAKKKTRYIKSNWQLNTIFWREFISGNGKEYIECHDGTVPAFMLRTGGTTGVPKEVVLSSRNFNSVAEGTYHSKICSSWDRQRTSILLMPPFIAFGIGSGIHHPLSFGIKLSIVLDVSPSVISKVILKHRPNYIVVGTVQAEQFMIDLKNYKGSLNYLKMLAIGGEAMSSAFEETLQKFLKEHNCSIIPTKGYGLTETAGSIMAETINVHRIGSVGIPIGFSNIKIVDPDTGNELSYDTPGEICLSGPSIMQGYYKNQEATDDVIETINGERWLHTGDIGILSTSGLVTITGRIKRIIVCKEGIIYHKVFPLVIEDQLSKISGVQEISLVGRPDDNAGNVLVAYVVPDNPENFEEIVKNLQTYSNSSLELYERPIDYVCMEKLPRTMIGKVNYRALEELERNK